MGIKPNMIEEDLAVCIELNAPFYMIQDRLNSIKANYTDHFNFSLSLETVTSSEGESYVRVNVHAWRYETQHESNEKIRSIERKAKNELAKRKALYLELKKEFD